LLEKWFLGLFSVEIAESRIKRKISGGVEMEDGKIALENYMTILATCKKQGISFYEYVKNILLV